MTVAEVDGGTERLVRAGLDRAEDGLGRLLGEPVAIEIHVITLESTLRLSRLADASESEVTGIYLSFSGDLSGHCLLCIDRASTDWLLANLLGTGQASAELSDSALLEAGNITVSGLVNGLADRGEWKIQVSPPLLARDTLGSLVNTILAAASQRSDELLAVQARFHTRAEEVNGMLMLMPDEASLPKLIKSGAQ